MRPLQLYAVGTAGGAHNAQHVVFGRKRNRQRERTAHGMSPPSISDPQGFEVTKSFVRCAIGAKQRHA